MALNPAGLTLLILTPPPVKVFLLHRQLCSNMISIEIYTIPREQVDVEATFAVVVVIVRRRMSKRGVRFHNAVRPVRL